MSLDEKTASGNVFEQHLRTGLLMICVAVLVWVGASTEANNMSLARLDERSSQAKNSVDELKKTIGEEMYKRSDAKRDVDATNLQISELRTRVTALEYAVNARSRQPQGALSDWNRKQ